jgi:dTDP-glucose 4,6-dehydratase
VVRAVGREVYSVLGKDPTEAENLVRRVEDREGHDARRALDPSKAERELGFQACIPFEAGLGSTVRWFLDVAAADGSDIAG